MPVRVVVVGAGDLGVRLVAALVRCPEVDDVVLVGRRDQGPEQPARGGRLVRYRCVDVACHDAVAELLGQERPALIVQCASLLSPWHVTDRTDHVGMALRRAGFAIQLSAQLPLLMTVMVAARSASRSAPVVNCSYPDVTHPVLATAGLEPTLGIGNVGMIEARVRAELERSAWAGGRTEPLVRVLAHHSHVDAAMRGDPTAVPLPGPCVYLGDDGRRADALAFAGLRLPADARRNALTASVAVPVLRALLPGGPSVRTSAPGPQGLPGGWPVTIENGRVALDLPPGMTRAEGVDVQRRAARGDGIEAIDSDGTVWFTAAARRAVADLDPVLAAPLRPEEASERCARLMAVLRG